ncbi:MAG: hypothetical protein QM753_00320 [Thermomicrobiales bacterium]
MVHSEHFGTLWIFLMSRFRITAEQGAREPFSLTSIDYVYTIAEDPDLTNEILTYHWASEAAPPQRTYPHLHIGSCILNDAYRTKPASFPKLHIRTDQIPVAAFILMLIEEFGVSPLRSSWRHDLTATIAARSQDRAI